MAPLSSDLFFADVAAIYRNEPEPSFGSGRLIAPGLVLTAEHVVTLKKAGAVDTGWKLRLIRDRPPGRNAQWQGEAYRAKVVWRGGNGLDLALLSLEDEDQAPVLGKLIFASYDLAGHLSDVRAAGFPEAMWDADSRASESRLWGDLTIGAQNNPYSWMVPVAVVPNDVRMWRGMSGAAIAREDVAGNLHIFGVVESVLPNFAGGLLNVARLSHAFADGRFVAALAEALDEEPMLIPWGGGGPGPAAVVPPISASPAIVLPAFPSPLAKVVHLFDRRAPADYIDGLIRPGPVEVLVCGRDDDMLDLFVRRIEERTLAGRDPHAKPDSPARVNPLRREIVPIEWTDGSQPEARFIGARVGLLRLATADRTETDIAGALHRGLHQPGQAAWVEMRINAQEFTDGDVKPLQDWRRFWQDARAIGDLPPCGVIYTISGIADTLTPQLAQAFGVLSAGVVFLRPCDDRMVRDWCRDLQEWHAAEHLIEAARDLDQHFLPVSFRLRALDIYLKTGKQPP